MWLHASCDADGGLRFVVGDTGIGIAAEAQAMLFEPYASARTQPGAAPTEGSTGLGLAICLRLATLMQGRIEVKSEPGAGTSMTLTVPRPAEPAAAASGTRHGKVLVCDDDPVSRLMMTEMLRRCGIDAEDASNGDHALERWRRGGVSVIVTDLDMPGLSGRELIRVVRDAELGAAQSTAIVVCSGSDPAAYSTIADETVGHDAYLLKPVQMDILVQTLRELSLASA